MEILGCNTIAEFEHRWRIGFFKNENPLEIIEELLDFVVTIEDHPMDDCQCIEMIDLKEKLEIAEDEVERLNNELNKLHNRGL